MEETTIRRSKIYTYFYGRNTVFQKFLIVVAVLFLLLNPIADSASRATYYEKLSNYKEAYEDALDAYETKYHECRKLFTVNKFESVPESNTYTVERKAYNNALDKYKEAKKAWEDYSRTEPSEFMSGLCGLIGVGSALVAVIWILNKKLTFHSVGEEEYEAEIADRLAAAKAKGLEKLGVVAEQIEGIEPVAVNGVANTDDLVTDLTGGWMKMLISRIARFVLNFDHLFLGLLTVGIYSVIVGEMAQKMGGFVFFFLVSLGGVGYMGYRIYDKYEVNSFVPERVFNRLEKFAPAFILRHGSDDRVRVSLPSFNVYMFGKEQMYVYHAYVDIVTGETFGEGIHEYFYEDIVAVKSNQKTMKLLVRHGFLWLFLQVIRYQVENIAIATSGCTHQEAYIVDLDKSLLDEKFAEMRNLLKQKKDEE